MNRYLLAILFCGLIGLGIYVARRPPSIHQMPTWHVSCDRTKPKAQNEYDVIIVGGGFGGLSCGALLAKNGYKVCLVEKNNSVGGLCSSYKKEEFHFDYGAEDIGGLWERGAVRYLLHMLNLKKENFFVENTRRIIINDSFIDVSHETMEEALAKKFPEEEKAIHSFFSKAKNVYLEAYDIDMVKEWGIIIPQELVSTVMSKDWQKQYDLYHKNLIEWNTKTYQKVLDEYFQNSELKRILCGLLGYFGRTPATTSATCVISHTFGYFFFGGYQALRTSHHFAQTLAACIEKHGGKILRETKVDSFLIEKGAAKGIEIGGESLVAPVIVSNVNAKSTYLDLIDSQYLSKEFIDYINSLPMGDSAFILHLGVNSTLEAFPSIIQDKDNQTFISIPSKQDPTLAPKGKSTVILRENARFANFLGKSPQELDQYTKMCTQKLLGKGKKLIPELESASIIKTITPLTFERLVDIPQGSIYGFANPNQYTRPFFKSPIKGLYLSSATCEGPGIESVVRNGILCSHDIMGWTGNTRN